MSAQASRAARVGDRVKVQGGPYEDRVGRVERTVTPDEPMFAQGPRPIVGLLKEDMALINGEDGNQFSVPVRRLQIL